MKNLNIISLFLSVLGTSASCLALYLDHDDFQFVSYFFFLFLLVFISILLLSISNTIKPILRNERISALSLINLIRFKRRIKEILGGRSVKDYITSDGSQIEYPPEKINSVEDIPKKYGHGELFLSFYPRKSVNSVQFCLFSKIKELQKIGIKPVFVLFDFDYSKNDISNYYKLLKIFFSNYPYTVFLMSEKQGKETDIDSFKNAFLSMAGETTVSELVELSDTAYGVEKTLVSVESIESCIGGGQNYRVSKKEILNLFYPTSKYSVKKIMLPLYELMQLLYMAIGTRAQKKLYIMSGLNLRNFWEYAEQKFDFKFIKILIPMIGSLTSGGLGDGA